MSARSRSGRRPGPRTETHHAPVAPMPARGTATFTAKSCSSKLAPVTLVPTKTRPRPVAVGPFVSTTNTSIGATCSNACPFKNAGCYVQTGFTRFPASRLDLAAQGHTAEEVIAEEVRLIDRAFRGGRIPQDGKCGGRDLRLHVGGDTGSVAGARMLAGAATRWRARGGGRVWGFTHRHRQIRREAWGEAISVLASVERPEDIEAARERGYAAAIVVASFPSTIAFSLPGTTARIVPCPAETRGLTCVECGLCLDAGNLLAKNVAIAFEAHGPGKKKVRQTLARQVLVQLRLKAAPVDERAPAADTGAGVDTVNAPGKVTVNAGKRAKKSKTADAGKPQNKKNGAGWRRGRT